jgi:hypothetical protein
MQNFFRGHRVKVTEELPKNMNHFQSGCEAIIIGSYSDIYDSDAVHDHIYTLLLLIGNEDLWYTSAWYPEKCLTLMDNDRDTGENMIQEHKILVRKLEEQIL